MHLHQLAMLTEKVGPLPLDLSIEESIGELEKRLSACRRGLSLAHRLPSAVEKKRHFSAILTNMNMIRGELARTTRQLEQFMKAESDHENQSDA